MDATSSPGTPAPAPAPAAHRPAIDDVLRLAPDGEDVALLALQAGAEEPLFHAATREADAEVARHIAEALPPSGDPALPAALDDLDADLAGEAMPLVRKAVAARNALDRADAAWRAAAAAARGDPAAVEAVAARAAEALRAAALAGVAACDAASRLLGAARAIDLARRGEPWREPTDDELLEALLAGRPAPPAPRPPVDG